MSNADQVDYWNGEAGQKWVRNAENLDALMNPFVDLILKRAELQSGHRVLDVGCGAGALLLSAAKSVTANGGLTGVDISAPLLKLARERAKAASIDADFIEEDAASFKSEQLADVAISRFGVMFFSDPVAAFSSMRQNLRPEGRLVFACWRGLQENDWALAPLLAAMPFFTDPPPAPDPEAPGPFAFADQARVSSILERAGWKDVSIEPWAGDILLPGDTIAESADFMFELGPVARIVEEQSIDANKVLAALRDRLGASLNENGQPRLGAKAWIVWAKAT